MFAQRSTQDFILLRCDTLGLNAEEVFFSGIYNLEDEVSAMSRNAKNRLHSDAASYPGKT